MVGTLLRWLADAEIPVNCQDHNQEPRKVDEYINNDNIPVNRVICHRPTIIQGLEEHHIHKVADREEETHHDTERALRKKKDYPVKPGPLMLRRLALLPTIQYQV